MLTEEELTNAFKVFDKDHKGSINAIDTQDLLAKVGYDITPLEAYQIVAEADRSGAGEVSYSDFVAKVLNNQ